MTVIFIAIIALALGAGLFFLFRILGRGQAARSFSQALFLIKIPHDAPRADTEGKALRADIGKFEQLLSGLAALKAPFVFEVAVPHVGEEIHFYLAVPKVFGEVAVKQVQGLWNGASVEYCYDDYSIFNAQGAVAAAYILEKEHFALPIRTYSEMNADSFSAIAGGFTKIQEIGEGAAIQIVAKPASTDASRSVYGYLRMLKRGTPVREVFKHPLGAGIGATLTEQPNPKEHHEAPHLDEGAIKALEAKGAKPLFVVNVRLVASAPSPFQANDILDGLLAGFNQFGAPARNEFKAVKQKNPQKLVYQFVFREFDGGTAMTLSSEEIASFYHLPIASTETPRVKWLKSKEAPPPPNLPTSGTLIGESVFRGQIRPVYITDEDRRRHLYLVGQTGTGKSTLIGNMVIEDIRAGKGVAVIDPHGDLVTNTLGFIPPSRASDVIYFDPSDLERPMGLNMLDFNFNRPEEKTFIVNEMQGIFNKLFPPETMGPMFEQYMRNALLLLMEDMANEPTTLIEVPRVFTDSEYRKHKLARVRNPVVLDFWEKEAAKAGGEGSLANMTPYVTSKFNNFISNDYMRPIIGQAKSAFNFRKAMDEGKIILINLSKGRIGDINAGLLGMIVTGKILMAALSRVDIAEGARRDFNLYIDEFQNFTTDSIATILSEARKYRLNLTMAHQFIAQLAEKIRDAVFGNVGSQVVFRVGPQDADFLVKQFSPTFNQNDLQSIDNLNAYAKVLIHGETSSPFNIKIKPTSWGGGDREFAENLRQASRAAYGQDRHAIEAQIYERLRG